jgi:hypothetical protein
MAVPEKAVMTPDEGLAARIAEWRRLARLYAREAVKEFQDDDGDDDKAAACAALSTMYYAVALDAHTFGNLPDINEERRD